MKMKFAAIAVGIAAVLLSACTAASMNDSMGSMDRAMIEQMLDSWPETAAKSAREAIGKYGSPNEATASMLVWHNNGPWKRSIVYRDEVQHDFPMPHKDVWEQFIDYRVAPEMFDELAQYDGSVIVERTKGEISARCDKEGANFLAINLAHDIVTGRRSVEEARRFYADTIKAMMEGRMSPYLQGFQFNTPRGNTMDRDRPAGM